MVLASRYRVVRQIGQGGMGVVLEAEHTVSGKRVAIKWLHPKIANEPDAGQRFLREARAAARVRHPNVVDVYDVLQHDGAVFLVMELLEGESLQQVLERGQLPIPELIALLIEAMRGVSAAHQHGVVHRDIKPENIFLTRMPDRATPCPKLLDFGISKLTEHADGGDNLKLTQTGEALGTPMYMSYEQLQGARDIDGRADVYAFAVILYEALTGQPPYVADTFSQLLLMIATQEPPAPKQLRPEVPSELDAVVRRAMAKDRHKRTPSLAALIAQLQPFASEAAFRAQMTAQNAPTPAIRPPSEPNGRTRVRPHSGLRAAGLATPAGSERSSSDLALQRMRPRAARWVAFLLGVFALAVAGGYLLRRPSAASTPSASPAKATATTQSAQPQSPPQPTLPPTVVAAPVVAAGARKSVVAAPTPEPPKTKRPRPKQPPPTAVPAGTQPSSTPVPTAVPERSTSPRLRAGQPRRQDF
jgi:serine/threonine-protein kinase